MVRMSKKNVLRNEIEEMAFLNTGENKTWPENPYPLDDINGLYNKKLRNKTIKQLEEVREWMIGMILEEEAMGRESDRTYF